MSPPTVTLLRDLPLFAGASAEELALVAARTQLQHLPARSLLFSKGDRGDWLYVLASGLVRIGVTSPDGRDVSYALIRPGQVFGEIAVLDGGTRSADATVMEDADLVALERRDLFAFLGRNPGHYARLVEILCHRLRSADDLLHDLFFLPASHRLAKHLLLLSQAAGMAGKAGCVLRISQQEVADSLGLSRERVNKLLSGWEKTGTISLGRGRITLNDPAALDAEDSVDCAPTR